MLSEDAADTLREMVYMLVMCGRKYRLSEFPQLWQDLGQELMHKTFLGFVRVHGREIVGDFWERVGRIEFEGEDSLSLVYKVTTKGNDLLAAMGAAADLLDRQELERRKRTR